MNKDQRFAARRTDVLVFQTESLKEPITVTGPIEVDLWVKTSGGDADFVVKLIDVQPGQIEDWPEMKAGERRAGYQTLVMGDIFRARHREGLDRVLPMRPGTAANLKFKMPDAFHTFEKGHKIMIQIQSSWFPLFDRNPQTWVENLFQAKEEDFRKATHTVLIGGNHSSRISFLTTSSTCNQFGSQE